jgi:YD repeat-containing protein
VSNRTLKLDPRGNRLTYSYDGVRRLKTERLPAGLRNTYSYDPNGNRTRMVDATGTYTSVYDAKNRTTLVVYPTAKRLTYAYDGLDRRTRLVDADGGRFTYTFDANNRLTLLLNPQAKRASFGAQGVGNRFPVRFLDFPCFLRVERTSYRHGQTAAGTEPARVLICCVHQHDAPIADLQAQRLLQSKRASGSMGEVWVAKKVEFRTPPRAGFYRLVSTSPFVRSLTTSLPRRTKNQSRPPSPKRVSTDPSSCTTEVGDSRYEPFMPPPTLPLR